MLRPGMTEGYVKSNGTHLLVAEAPWIEDGKSRIGRLAVFTETLKGLMDRGQGVAIAQLYGLVIPGLILTRHVFQGLKRPLFCDGSPQGDKTKLVYARRPAFDYVTARSRETGQLEALRREPPPGKTFLVVVSPNRHGREHPDIDGWIDHWNWAEEDGVLAEAPVNWVDRYDKKIFSATA
jgi:hypothetical protein